MLCCGSNAEGSVCTGAGRPLEEGDDGTHNMMVITARSTTAASPCLPKGTGRKHNPNVRVTCSGWTEIELAASLGREKKRASGSTETGRWLLEGSAGRNMIILFVMFKACLIQLSRKNDVYIQDTVRPSMKDALYMCMHVM